MILKIKKKKRIINHYCYEAIYNKITSQNYITSSISFSLTNLFFNGFIAAYLCLFHLIICALLALLFFGKYVVLLFSSNTVNEILGLLISNLYFIYSQMVLVLIFFLDDERYHSNVVKLVLNI